MTSQPLTVPVPSRGKYFLMMAGAVFLLLVYYAYAHIIEYDEAWTYLSVKNESVADLIAYKNYNIANNHILNSLWFKLLQQLGAKHIFFYRMASLGCFILYASFLWRWIRFRANFWTAKSDWWLLLFFLPPVIFFFGTGRGYGMATAFFCGAFYYMKRFIDDEKPASYWMFILLGLLCSLSIVSFFFPFVALLSYVLIKRFPKEPFSFQYISSGLLIAATAFYIYHVGRIIIAHDTIINGTDNLFRYGMYSTFFSSLGLIEIVFPDRVLYNQWHLGTISKYLILLSFIPVALIILRRFLFRYTELLILYIVTALFLLSHILLHAKYPSDRSVVYLYFLIYIPVIFVIIQKNNWFFKIHYFVLLGIAIINFFGYYYELSRRDLYAELRSRPPVQYSIYSDWPNWGDEVMNEFSFDGRLTFHYLAKSFEQDLAGADERIRQTAADPNARFILLQQSAYERNKDLFKQGFVIKPLISSAAKELYFIERRTQ